MKPGKLRHVYSKCREKVHSSSKDTGWSRALQHLRLIILNEGLLVKRRSRELARSCGHLRLPGDCCELLVEMMRC